MIIGRRVCARDWLSRSGDILGQHHSTRNVILFYQPDTRPHFTGSIYKAQHLHTNQTAALKLQLVDHECPTNRYERSFYPALQGGTGMPTLFGSGVQGKYDFLVIQLLGASLDNLYRKSGQNIMDLRSVCCIAMQVVRNPFPLHNHCFAGRNF